MFLQNKTKLDHSNHENSIALDMREVFSTKVLRLPSSTEDKMITEGTLTL